MEKKNLKDTFYPVFDDKKVNPVLDNIDHKKGEWKVLEPDKPKHIICFSGGKSSALVACMVVQKFGNENVILLNHEVRAEPLDVERFENEVASYLRLPITYANADQSKYPTLTPYEVSQKDRAFGVKQGVNNNVLCTSRLKTEPFDKWLEENYEEGDIIYYGFDKDEVKRIQRRSSFLGQRGYKTDYPLALWENPLDDTFLEFIQVKPPMQYKVFKHANCVGCIKGGQLHWLCIYVHKREVFDQFKELELELGHSIIKGAFLEDLEPKFEATVKLGGINITEHQNGPSFWARVRRLLKEKEIGQKTLLGHFLNLKEEETKPCQCI